MSRNEFIVQLISDLVGIQIERPCQTDMTALGAAYMAGLASGQSVKSSYSSFLSVSQYICVWLAGWLAGWFCMSVKDLLTVHSS